VLLAVRVGPHFLQPPRRAASRARRTGPLEAPV